MALTVRENILAAAYATLQAVSGVSAFRNLTSLAPESEFPAVVLFDGGESPGDVSPGGTNFLTLQLELELWVTANDENALGPALNDLLAKVSAAMFADVTHGQNAFDTFYAGMATPRLDRTEGAAPMMGALVNFTIQYQTARLDLTATGP